MLSYEELQKRTDAPAGSAWGLWGKDDELGTVNFITPECVTRAAGLVNRGAVFNLDCAINAFNPTWTGRRLAEHVIYSGSGEEERGAKASDARDDYIDSFYMQATSQLDGLRHVRHFEHGFYNWTPDEAIIPYTSRIGVQAWAESGIVGRGVLLDVGRYLQAQGNPLDLTSGDSFPVSVLDETAEAQGVEILAGDILLIRTGWVDYYLNVMTDDDRKVYAEAVYGPGLRPSYEAVAWLWDHQISVVAADNPAVESFPAPADSPFPAQVGGLMHADLIALLGFVLGELFALEALGEDCAEDGVYEFLVMSKALNLVGGVGSPPNALAVK